MRKKVKVTKKLAAAGLAAILACQVMGCGTGEKPRKMCLMKKFQK